eukprot:scaffold312907_cov15-Prasinocladus_malaysianus.AAC.1
MAQSRIIMSITLEVGIIGEIISENLAINPELLKEFLQLSDGRMCVLQPALSFHEDLCLEMPEMSSSCRGAVQILRQIRGEDNEHWPSARTCTDSFRVYQSRRFPFGCSCLNERSELLVVTS